MNNRRGRSEVLGLRELTNPAKTPHSLLRLLSNSKAGVGSMVGKPSAGRESAALHVSARPEASKASAAALAAEREKGSQREVEYINAKMQKKKIPKF